MKPPLFRTREDVWNAVFMLAFLSLAITISFFIDRSLLYNFQASDAFILVGATFRLIRLFTYDKITAFLRTYLAASGDQFGQTLSELIICPWCTGIWAALFCMGFYLLIPGLWIFFLILAVAGVASFVQIVTNSFIRYSEKSIAEKEKIEGETRGFKPTK